MKVKRHDDDDVQAIDGATRGDPLKGPDDIYEISPMHLQKLEHYLQRRNLYKEAPFSDNKQRRDFDGRDDEL